MVRPLMNETASIRSHGKSSWQWTMIGLGLLVATATGATEWATNLPCFHGGGDDGWDRDCMGAALGLGGPDVGLASESNQVFRWTMSSAELADLTITVSEPKSALTNGGTVRIHVPSGWGCRFDGDAELLLSGSASVKVNSPVVSEDGRSLGIPIVSDFAAGDTLTIGGLRLLNLHLCRQGNQRLGLDVEDDGTIDRYDGYTLDMLALWAGGGHVGWGRRVLPSALTLGGGDIEISSVTNQVLDWRDVSHALLDLTITVIEPKSALTNGGTFRIRVPSGWGCRFDTDAELLLSGSAAAKINAPVVSEDGRSLGIPIVSDFLAGDTLTIGGLRLLSLRLCRPGIQRMELDIDDDGTVDAYDRYALEMLAPWAGGGYDGWDCDENERYTSLTPPPTGMIFLAY